MSKICEEMGIKIMALTDGELSEKESSEVRDHLESCAKCQNKYSDLNSLKEIMMDIKLKKMPDMYWDDYWSHVYNRLERGIAWIFFSIGAIILILSSVFVALQEMLLDPKISMITKSGTVLLLIGAIVLFVSVVREKIMVRKIDRYRKVTR